jgi:ABC-type uncharacterized transport system ATPase subunit
MKTYEAIRNHPPDFIVKYRLYSPQEGGRKVTCQHLRCDFKYAEDDPDNHTIYMIHPEFLDESGKPVEENIVLPLEGRASMWILMPEMRANVHRTRAKVGVHGHFVEGSRKIGDVEIESIVGLHENPSA